MDRLERVQGLEVLAAPVVDAYPGVVVAAHGQLREACPAPMHPADGSRAVVQAEHGQQIERDHVEDLDRVVGPSGCEAAPVCADVDRPYLARVRLELFDELDAAKVLLPELDNPIDRAGYEEVGVGREGGEGQLVAVHQRLGVALGGRQRSNVQLLIGQLALLLLGRGRGQCRAKIIVVRGGVVCRRQRCCAWGCNTHLPSFAWATGSFMTWSSASISARERLDLLGDSDPFDAMAVECVLWGGG